MVHHMYIRNSGKALLDATFFFNFISTLLDFCTKPCAIQYPKVFLLDLLLHAHHLAVANHSNQKA